MQRASIGLQGLNGLYRIWQEPSCPESIQVVIQLTDSNTYTNCNKNRIVRYNISVFHSLNLQMTMFECCWGHFGF